MVEKTRHRYPSDRPAGEVSIPPSAAAFVAVGAAAVVGGGVVAAATGPAGWDDGSWVAAFLVLVAGVGQIGLGAAQAVSCDVARGVATVQLVTYNAGSALVLVGTLFAAPAVVTVGGLALAVALALFLDRARRGDTASLAARLQMALSVVLLVSVPVGIALSWIRA